MLLAVAGCSGTSATETGPTPVDPPDSSPNEALSTFFVEYVSERATPQGLVHINTTLRSDEIHVTLAIDGQEWTLDPAPTTASDLGAVYPIGDSVPVGSATLSMRSVSGGPPSRTSVTLIDPWFRRVDLAAEHWTPQRSVSYAHVGGVAAVDLTGDRRADIVLGLGDAGLMFMLNTGGTFEEVPGVFPTLLGVGAITAVDFDSDGDPDLLVASLERSVLLLNQLVETGQLGFVDATTDWGIDLGKRPVAGWAPGDFDGDGDLDLYVVHRAEGADRADPNNSRDQLFRNDDGHFVNVSDWIPESLRTQLALAAVWFDYDRDGDLDLAVISDHLDIPLSRPNVLLRNDGKDDGIQVFTDASDTSGLAILPDGKQRPFNGMGVAVADIDRDGLADLLVSNVGPNALLIGDGERFVDTAPQLGLERRFVDWAGQSEAARWSVTWSVHAQDMDNDGDIDPMFIGGSQPEWFGHRNVPHALFLQTEPMQFRDVTVEAGLMDPRVGIASAVFDANEDGLLDVVVVNADAAPSIFHNRQAATRTLRNHWLRIRLQGAYSNRDGLGSVVTLTANDGRIQTCFVTPRPSFSASSALPCHFGLGTTPGQWTHGSVDWPQSATQAFIVETYDTTQVVVQDAPAPDNSN
jgi:hypothetical protein